MMTLFYDRFTLYHYFEYMLTYRWHILLRPYCRQYIISNWAILCVFLKVMSHDLISEPCLGLYSHWLNMNEMMVTVVACSVKYWKVWEWWWVYDHASRKSECCWLECAHFISLRPGPIVSSPQAPRGGNSEFRALFPNFQEWGRRVDCSRAPDLQTLEAGEEAVRGAMDPVSKSKSMTLRVTVLLVEEPVFICRSCRLWR